MVVGPLAKPFLPAAAPLAESSSTTLTSSLLGEGGSLLIVTTLVPAKTAKQKQIQWTVGDCTILLYMMQVVSQNDGI